MIFRLPSFLFVSNLSATHQMINVDFCEREHVGDVSARYAFEPYIQKETKSAQAFYSVPLVSEIKDFFVLSKLN